MSTSIIDAPHAGAYVAAWRTGKEITREGGTVRLFRDGRELDADGFAREMDRALQARINIRGGLVQCGRRMDDQYQTELQRDAWELQAHRESRVRLWGLNGRRWRTDIVQARLGHLLDGGDFS